MFLQDLFGRDAARDHRVADDFALRKARTRRKAGSRRYAAADDRPAKQAFAPEIEGFIDATRDILAGAEHEQEIGGLDRRADQMLRIDVGNFRLGRPPDGIFHGPPRAESGATMPCLAGFTKSRFIALDCGRSPDRVPCC
jgi:hypothetical protein